MTHKRPGGNDTRRCKPPPPEPPSEGHPTSHYEGHPTSHMRVIQPPHRFMPQAPNNDEPFIIVIAGAKHTHVRDLTTILSICPIDPSLPANPLCLPHTPRSPTTDRINCTRTPMPVIFLTHSRPTSTAHANWDNRDVTCVRMQSLKV